jgi:hypothetical protein
VLTPRPFGHPGDTALSLDSPPAFGNEPGERSPIPPAWLADALVMIAPASTPELPA